MGDRPGGGIAGSVARSAEPAGTLLHRGRNLAARPLWLKSDLILAGLLATLLAPSWLLPERAWAPLCRALAPLRWLTGPRARTAANIQAALDEPDPRRAEAIVLALNAAILELHMQDLRGWLPGGWRPPVALQGEEHLARAREDGKGAVLWVAHMVFNNLAPKLALHRRGHRVSHLSILEHGDAKSRLGIAWLNPVRRIPEDRYLAERIMVDRRAPSVAMARMARALEAGNIVTIAGVASEGSGVMRMPFLGGITSLVSGAPRLAAQTGAALLPVFVIRDPALGFRVVIEAPIETTPGMPSNERCIAAAREFLRRCEPWVRQFPEQWRGWGHWRQQ